MKHHPTFTNYLISENGEVTNKITNRKLKPYINRWGYEVIVFLKDKKRHNKKVHRLVLETYCPIEDAHLYHCHHKNHNKTDNRLENLEWVLPEEHASNHHKGKKRSEETRKKMSEAKKGGFSAEHRRKLSEAKKGKKRSEETRRKISESKKGRVPTEESRNKMSEAMKGRKWWNNGVKNIMSYECPGEGWELGRTGSPSEETRKKMSDSLKGRKYWNNGVKNIMSYECPGEGWKLGRTS